MSDEQAAPETKGVTAELLATVDLGPEIEGMAGRQLRMRMVTIEPGGVFGPIHDHRDRPGIVYVLQGTITDHRDGVATHSGRGRTIDSTNIRGYDVWVVGGKGPGRGRQNSRRRRPCRQRTNEVRRDGNRLHAARQRPPARFSRPALLTIPSIGRRSRGS
jgi:hypothetical protein